MIKNIIREKLDALIIPWAKFKGIETLPYYSIEEPPKNIDADLASNISMLLARQIKTAPRKVAEELIPLLEDSLSPYINKVSIAGAGFLNFKLSDSYMYRLLFEILEEESCFGKSDSLRDEKVLIEFVSANPTGPLHIGHGRGAAIGDSLARVYSYLGYNVQKEYYLNDVGNQMDMLGKSLESRYRELLGEKIEFPENGYKGEYIKDIAKKLLETGKDKTNIDFKQTALREMTATIEKDLVAFDIHFDTWFSESKIALDKSEETENKTAVDKVCEYLLSKNLAYEKDNALWFASTGFGDDKDRVLKRSDGRYTYLASDIAYHENKLKRGYSKMINLWGADHHGYVARMKAAIASLGSNPDTLTMILYQLVALVRNGIPVAMSTRSGEFITLEQVINEVGKDACRFFFLLRAPDSQLDFDMELAKKKSSENPVFYVQYVHARCCSIFREYQLKNKDIPFNKTDLSLLNTKDERDLMRKLIFFPDTLDLCIKNQSPHYITVYLIETADLFHRFYEKCRVLNDDKNLSLARLSLVKGVAVIIKAALNLLGVSAPEKM